MQTRRDHIQAYQFSTDRLVHALTAGDPGIGEQPLRRGNFGTVLGLVIALMLGGGAIVYGLISPAPDNSWRSQGSIIVEKETGTRYVLLDAELRPTANYASALLAAGSQPKMHMIAHAALAGIPIGQVTGIAGAPDVLPSASALLPGAWALCLSPAGTGDTVLDLAPYGRAAPAPRQPVVVAATGTNGVSGQAIGEYVLWGAEKYPVPNASVLAALGLGNDSPIQAAPKWLDLLPTGDALSPVPIPSAGKAGMPVAGQPTRVGQVFQTTAASVDQFYVLRDDGLAPITRTEAALFATRPRPSQPPIRVGPSDIAVVPASHDQSLLNRLPDLLSATPYAPDGARLCALQGSAAPTANPNVSNPNVSNTAAANPTAVNPTLVTEPDRLLAGTAHVLLPPGTGLLAQTASVSPATRKPDMYLITDAGERFKIDGGTALQALGYGSAPPHTVPDAILALIAAGPVLNVDAAKKAVS